MYNYTYHPYRPYFYGSFFHPFGFFVDVLSATALTIAWENQYYRYDQGVYYSPYNNGYRVIPPPAGLYIRSLPAGYTTIQLGDYTYYYFAGTFYEPDGNGYSVTQAPPGAVVYDLPEGATEVRVGNIVYLQYNNTLFQPISINGRDAYEVVELENENNN